MPALERELMDKEPPFQVIVEKKPGFNQRFWLRESADLAVSIHRINGYSAVVILPGEDLFGEGTYGESC